MDKEGHIVCQYLVGTLHGLCTIERADIQFSACSLSHFSACPYKGKLKAVERILFKGLSNRQTKINHLNIKRFPVVPTDLSLKNHYPKVFEELD